jgi:3-phenylpropionate/cinnamic acid dioxygenase small subunit
MADEMTIDVARVAAELEIRGLLARVAQLSDSGDIDTYLTLWTEDAVWEMTASPRAGLAASTQRGRDAIVEGARARLQARADRPDTQSLHCLTTTAVAVDGDNATVDSYFLFVICGPSDVKLQNAGRYHDTARRTEDGWKLTHRMITFA